MTSARTYLALGDSMSIDDYTGVAGGGAVRQFHRRLEGEWRLDDRTLDGCRMPHVPRDARGDLITVTIGGNDLLLNREHYLRHGLDGFAREHLALLRAIRRQNPEATLIVGDVYRPAQPLAPREAAALAAANEIIRDNVAAVGARLAPIYDTFLDREPEYLCLGIEPTLAGATAIAALFEQAYRNAA